MTFTIDFGWWLAPLAFTILAAIWAIRINAHDRAHTPYSHLSGSDAVTATIALIIWSWAAAASLLAWLIWAVLT